MRREDSTDNESRSPWEHTGVVAKYHQERRLARARGEEWPPRVDLMPPSSDDEDSNSDEDDEYEGIGIGDDIPNLPASVSGDTDAGFNLKALAVGPMPPTPPSEDEEGGMPEECEMPKVPVSHYVTPPKRPGVSAEPHQEVQGQGRTEGVQSYGRYLAGYTYMRVIGGVGWWFKTSAEIASLTLARYTCSAVITSKCIMALNPL